MPEAAQQLSACCSLSSQPRLAARSKQGLLRSRLRCLVHVRRALAGSQLLLRQPRPRSRPQRLSLNRQPHTNRRRQRRNLHRALLLLRPRNPPPPLRSGNPLRRLRPNRLCLPRLNRWLQLPRPRRNKRRPNPRRRASRRPDQQQPQQTARHLPILASSTASACRTSSLSTMR